MLGEKFISDYDLFALNNRKEDTND